MAYQDDFRNKVLQALKAKNLAVDISQEATQKAIVEEAQNVANAEARPMSPEEMKLVLQDVSKQLAAEAQQFSAQSSDFTAFAPQEEGGPGGSYSGGGIAVSVMNKDILIIPTAGTATSINTLSQIDFKIISNPNAYGVIDPKEVKSSLYNWGERVAGNTYDTPVLGLGGAWNGISYTPTSQWGIGGSQGSGIAGSISVSSGFGQIIYFKPASSTIYAGLFNDLGINVDYSKRSFTLTGYNAAIPGSFPTGGFAVTFGGIGNSGDLIIQGAISEAQTNTIKFLSPLTISNSTATDTITLGLSSATSTVQNFVGGGSAQYTLSTTTSSFAQGDIFYASGTGHVTLTKLAIGGNNTYLTSNGSVPSWTGSIAANTVAVNAATGSTILYPLLNNIAGSGAAISTDVDFSVDPGANILRYSTGSFYVGTAVSAPTFTYSGDVAIKPGVNSTTAIQLDNVAGTPILNVDTTNSRIGINNVTAPAYTLDVAGDINASTGSVYRINGTSVLSNNTLGTGVVTSSLTTVGVIGSGTWSATAITAHYGGTGLQTPFAIGDLLYANTATTWARLADVATGSVLASGGVGVAPSYVLTNTLSVGTAVTANNLNVVNATTAAQHFVHFSPTATGTGIATSSNTTISFNPNTFILSTSGLAVTNTTATTSTTSGALIVSGGLGLAGNAFIGGTAYIPSSTPSNISNLLVSNNTATTSTTSGALVVSGGLGLAGNAFIGSTVYVPSTTPSNFSNLLVSNNTATTSTTSGALVVSGGLGLAGNAFIGGTINVPSTSTSNVSNVLFANGVVTSGVWQGTAVGTTYGGTGSNLSPSASVGNSNRIYVSGGSGQYAATLINNATSGNLLVSGGALAAPTFTNTTSADFTFGGTLNITTAAITNGTITGTPTNANDIVNKSYADSISGGLDVHASGRLTTVSAIGGSYRQSGTAGTTWGIGDYIISTTPGSLIGSDAGWDTVGIALTNGQRVLVKDGVLGGYASGAGAYGAYPTTYGGFSNSWVANGIYEVRSYGGAATSGWLLVRATDTDNQNGVQELTGGSFLFIEEGATYADHAFVCSNNTTSNGPIGFGSTQIEWTLFAGGNTLIAGQGLVESGNNLALLVNLVQATAVNANLSRGFTLGGARAASLGSSTYANFTVTGANAVLSTNTFTANTTGFQIAGGETNTTLAVAGVPALNTLTGNSDGWQLAGGTSSRTLTVTGSNITLTGGGNTLTLTSNSTLALNSQTLTLTSSMGNLAFNAGNTTPSASTQNIVQSGVPQFVLSTSDTNYLAGDIYYGAGTAYTALARLGFTSGTGNSVLIRGANAPAWGTIALGNSNFVSGQLGLSNGGTNANLTAVNGGAVYSTGSSLAITGAGTANSVLLSTGASAPIWGAVVLSSSASVTGTLPVTNGGTGAATFTGNGILYGNTTGAIQVTGAAANAILVTNGSNVPSLATDIPTAVTIGGAYIYRVGGTDVSLADGGTNASLTAVNGGAVYSTGSSLAITGAGTANSVLLSTGAGAPIWGAVVLSSSASVTGTLGIANGGTNATSANYTTNGVVIYDGTRLTSATGITMTGGVGLSVNGTTSSTGGFFIAGNSVISSITSNTVSYGAINITTAASVGGTSYFSNSASTVTLNYPGTGITGGGAQYQVAYYNAAREISGNTAFTWNTAGSGNGLSITSSGFGLSINNTSTTATPLFIYAANSSGNLIDARTSGTTEFSVRFDGFTTAGGGLTVQAGKTTLAIPTTTFASVNLPSSSGTNPGSGNTQVGDLWFNGTNLYFRKDATTNFDLLVGSVSGSGTANKIAKWSTSSALTDSNITDAGVGMTITSTTSVGAGGGSTAVLTLQTISADNSLTDRYFVRGVTSAGTKLFSIDTAGNLRATTKSFDIPHPTKEGMRLVYGVLEGPEHGVYHRGTVEGKGVIQINLPDYWHKLVGDQYTIQLTPWGNYNVSIDTKTENYFTIQLVGDFISRKFKNIKVDYIVHGSRLDAPLDTEQ
jgi:hypothetical protein